MEGTTRYVDFITNVMNIISLTNVIAISCICISLCKRYVDISCVYGIIVNGVWIYHGFFFIVVCVDDNSLRMMLR